ncbi:MAG: hypothetical protein QM579_10840 [Desulfovibrio sp.]|uniref:hypothetical protein n=1 Tax=Desulfovibrio sp. TaxID=885 RepID=UPI0039E36C18
MNPFEQPPLKTGTSLKHETTVKLYRKLCQTRRNENNSKHRAPGRCGLASKIIRPRGLARKQVCQLEHFFVIEPLKTQTKNGLLPEAAFTVTILPDNKQAAFLKPTERSYALNRHEKGRLLMKYHCKKGHTPFCSVGPNYTHIFSRYCKA